MNGGVLWGRSRPGRGCSAMDGMDGCSQHEKQKTFLSSKSKAALSKDMILFRTHCFILFSWLQQHWNSCNKEIKAKYFIYFIQATCGQTKIKQHNSTLHCMSHSSHPEDGGRMLIRNVHKLLSDYMALHCWRQQSLLNSRSTDYPHQ